MTVVRQRLPVFVQSGNDQARDTPSAMSQDNMEAVRAVYDEWAKGNFRAGGDLWDSRVVFVPLADLPDAGDYFGLEGITTFMRAFLLNVPTHS